MPEYLAPGVYVEEIEIGGKPIEGVSTSTAGFVGVTERGPDGAHLITGVEEYRRRYGAQSWMTGGQEGTSVLPYAVEGFFQNGGKRCFIARVVGKDAKTARLELPGAAALGPAPGPRPIERPAPPEEATEAAPPQDGGAVANPPRPADQPSPGVVGQQGGRQRQPLGGGQAAAAAGDGAGGVMCVTAVGPGVWGNRIFVTISDSSLAGKAPERFRLVVSYRGERGEPLQEEVFDDLSPLPNHPSFYERIVNGASSLVRLDRMQGAQLPWRPGNTAAPAQRAVAPGTQPPRTPPAGSRQAPEGQPLTDGTDGATPVLEDYKGRERPSLDAAHDGQRLDRSGLGALASVDEISILCAPDEQSVPGLASEVVGQCERLADRFAVLSARYQDCFSVDRLEPASQVGGDSVRIDSKYAAFYAPYIKVIDATGAVRRMPPTGHVAGVYARSDVERGVWKAPANEVLRGVVGLDPEFNTGEQEILNPRGVNCIRTLPGRGIRVWGARTTSSDPLWRYVNVRRLFLFIEESIDQGTQWVVFEPNDQRLWARVRQTISDFLTSVWRSGALMGTTAEEAFFVKCDETTMTQNDLMTGRLIAVIGVAPSRPAEFVIFRIAQWTRGASETA